MTTSELIDLQVPVIKKDHGVMPSVSRRLTSDDASTIEPAGASSSSPSSPPPPSEPARPLWQMDAMGFFLTKGDHAFAAASHRLGAANLAAMTAATSATASAASSSEAKVALLADAVADQVEWWLQRARELDPAATAAATTSSLTARASSSTAGSGAAATSNNNDNNNSNHIDNDSDGGNGSNLAQWRRMLLREIRLRVRRRGISPAERAVAWPLLAGLECNRTARLERSMEALLRRDIDTEIRDVMLRDLGRTLPTHSLFREHDSVGQTSLEKILCCYCALDPSTSYCQGMGFIVAILLLHMPEPDAFAIFCQMMFSPRFQMRGLFQSGFPLLQRMLELFRNLLRRISPDLMDYFDAMGLDPAFFANHWLMTLFAYQLPVPVVCQIWDLFFSEGWVWIFRVAVALLVSEQEALLQMPMEEVLLRVKTIHEGKTGEEILRVAKDICIREADLISIEAECAAAEGDDEDEDRPGGTAGGPPVLAEHFP